MNANALAKLLQSVGDDFQVTFRSPLFEVQFLHEAWIDFDDKNVVITLTEQQPD